MSCSDLPIPCFSSARSPDLPPGLLSGRSFANWQPNLIQVRHRLPSPKHFFFLGGGGEVLVSTVKMCEEIYLIHTRAGLKWDWMPVTNSGGFITGMTSELMAVQLPDLCPTACRHSTVYILVWLHTGSALLNEGPLRNPQGNSSGKSSPHWTVTRIEPRT